MIAIEDYAVLYQADCLDALSGLPDNSVDSIVTDPPAGIAFMGKEWDKNKGGREQWIGWMEKVASECLRVLKPGGHALVWGLPRTGHWTCYAWESAGFEVRDCIAHIQGQGFPKSANISKMIDKQAGAERKVVGNTIYADGNGRAPSAIYYSEEKPKFQSGADRVITAPATSEAEKWDGWGTALKPSVEYWYLFRKPISEDTIADNVLRWGTGAINIDGCRIGGKPPSVPQPIFNSPTGRTYGMKTGEGRNGEGRNGEMSQAQGRFPANLVLVHNEDCRLIGYRDDEGYTINRFVDGAKPFGNGAGHGYETEKINSGQVEVWECSENCPVRILNEQSGDKRGAAAPVKSGYDGKSRGIYGDYEQRGDDGQTFYGDIGGAARFFYCPKSSSAERNAGLEGMEKVACGMMEDDNYPIKTGSGKLRDTKRENHHATVKPINLMRYLCKLITPPGGTVLDPFTGSGTTGCACALEGFFFVGIELDPEYVEIAEKRIRYWYKEKSKAKQLSLLEES